MWLIIDSNAKGNLERSRNAFQTCNQLKDGGVVITIF